MDSQQNHTFMFKSYNGFELPVHPFYFMGVLNNVKYIYADDTRLFLIYIFC